MRVDIYLSTLSSWCYVAGPAIERMRVNYGSRIEIEWHIARLDGDEALGYTPKTLAWYYERTHHVTGVHLSSEWIADEKTGSLEADLVTEAARDLGIRDDRVWTAIAKACLAEGKHAAGIEAASAVAAEACGLAAGTIAARARDQAIRRKIDASTQRFHDLGLPQRPSFILTNQIGDEARLCGTWRYEPLAAAVDALWVDEMKYAEYATMAPTEPRRS